MPTAATAIINHVDNCSRVGADTGDRASDRRTNDRRTRYADERLQARVRACNTPKHNRHPHLCAQVVAVSLSQLTIGFLSRTGSRLRRG